MKFYAYGAMLLLCVMTFLPCIAYSPGSSKTEETQKETAATITIYDHVKKENFTLDLEDYVRGVVLAEMPASFEEEALKAQAVAARTYAVSKILTRAHKDKNADICTDSTCCCAYVRDSDYKQGQENIDKVAACVKATKGQILKYNGQPISAAFHSMSAGKTESAMNVWGSDVPYLEGVDSSLEAQDAKFESTVDVNFSDFKAKLAAASPSAVINSAKDIGEPVRDSSNYVSTITIGGVSFTGPEIRKMFNLRSHCFYISATDTVVTFKVRGYGHGVGMSQYGANYLAKSGKKYDEILKTYYTGIEITEYK